MLKEESDKYKEIFNNFAFCSRTRNGRLIDLYKNGYSKIIMEN